MTAGYSCDIALCRLHPDNFEKLKAPMQELVSALKKGLPPPPEPSIIKDLILLAHWDAQSFWSENYTDLWDFCACLAKRCKDANTGPEIIVSCKAVQDALAPDGIVRLADNFGTEYQYARGLSIYFPWHEPFEVQEATSEQDSNKQNETKLPRKTILQNYQEYDFTKEFVPEHSWFSFLETYWKGTKRDPREESKKTFIDPARAGDLDPRERAGKEVYERAKDLLDKRIKRTPELKKTPDVGIDCTCPTIKNYPTSPPPKGSGNVPRFSITPGALDAFLPTKEPDEQ
jgi:hypothetical protein